MRSKNIEKLIVVIVSEMTIVVKSIFSKWKIIVMFLLIQLTLQHEKQYKTSKGPKSKILNSKRIK